MKSDRWRRIEELFHQTLDISEIEREGYLKTACQGDSDLLREVEGLLSSYKDPGSFMEEPVVLRGFQMLSTENVGMPKGKLGRYEIIKPIGTGGMGNVFLAHDSVLDRSVALKFLSALLTNDPQRVRRFQQEAHAASTISHPNVAHIYEMGSEGNYHFTSMEYVEGHTLREVLNRSRLSVPEALDIAVQVGRALQSAHASRVIHRDIKPENIMIRPDGYVKVLDFGIAKLDRIHDRHDPRLTQIATLVHTEPGLIMGSPAYMSPEQARGVDVDERTDIWSLGVVLYEMLCGWTPFQGSTNMDLIAALLREEPAPISLPLRHAHPRLRKLLMRMLSKDKDQRYLTIAEVVNDLQTLIRDLRWNAGNKASSLFQGSRRAFLKHKALEAFRARESTVIRGPLPFFIMTIIVGVALTWSVRSFVGPTLLATNPESEKHYKKGVEAIFRDDFYGAAYELELAAKGAVYQHSLVTHARLAEVWAELDYSEKANYELSELAKLVPLIRIFSDVPHTESLYVNAANATVARNFRHAVFLYRQVVEKDPASAIAWMDLGRSYERLGWWKEAAYSYRQASSKDPSLASPFLRLGIMEGARKNEQEANAAFDRAQHLYSIANDAAGSWEVFNQRIILANQMGRKEEARNFEEQVFRSGYSNQYQHVKRNFSLARIFQGEVQRAKVLESEARKQAESISRTGLLFRGPDQLLVNGLLDLGLSYLRQNDLIRAQSYIIEAESIARRSDLKIGTAKALYAQAQQRLHEGFPVKADEYLKMVLRIEMPHGNFSDRTISLWRNTIFGRDYNAAIDELKKTVEHGDALILIGPTKR